jgi:type II secretory pathway pseudopilin PulG
MQRRLSKTRLKNQSGQAALIGLIVVIAIIAILSAIMYPKITGHSEYDTSGNQVGDPSPMDRADDATCISYESQVNDAISMYNSDHPHPPTSLQDLKRYGVTKEMIDTPNCNFVLPKNPPEPIAVAPTVPAPNSSITYITPGPAPGAAAPSGYAGGQGGNQQQAPPGGNTLLPTKMGRSISLDGGSANIQRQAGDDNGN